MKKPRARHFISAILVAFTILLAARGGADEIKLKLLPAGATAKLGNPVPQHITLSRQFLKPDELKTGSAKPRRSALRRAQTRPGGITHDLFFVIVDEPEGKPARLFVDANGKRRLHR